MKSILQEASTIAKAVEQAWKEAGEPQNFSIKVLELPQRNFIGLTTRSAKIAFIFNEVAPKSTEPAHHKHHNKPHTPKPQPVAREKTYAPQQPPAQRTQYTAPRETAPVPKKEPRVLSTERPEVKKRPEGLWNDDMVKYTQEWFGQVLRHMDRPDITFTIEQQNFYLRVTLSQPILTDPGQEKHLLASISLLMIASIKKQFRKALRGHKIVLTHAQQPS